MKIIATVREMQARSESIRKQGKRIAFVPTMGFLHEGHCSLLKKGRVLGDDLVLSIFVNPTQFGPGEDYDAYPRDMEKDLQLAEREVVDAVFTPSREELYGSNFQTGIELEKLPNHLCGLSRPSHFQGVALVVTKLFHIVKPHVAIFGEKDYQQLAIIRQMVRDLDFDIQIEGGAIVREKDGLAMSSRNAYLSAEQRKTALCLFQALQKARKAVAQGETDTAKIINDMAFFIQSHPDTEIDYISICDPQTLDSVDRIQKSVLLALAVKVGKTRLIDNMILSP
ncbi:MAG: pantoate--beta-alanine ligase [Desulfobacteraceae bacterium]|nr:MAG: pantoate--beta-alanine ligase [Desulfobacteraceae bacterium]